MKGSDLQTHIDNRWWYKHNSRVIHGKPTYWTEGHDTEGHWFWFYCPQGFWNLQREWMWGNVRNTANNGGCYADTYLSVQSHNLFPTNGNHQVLSMGQPVSVQVTINKDCPMAEAYNFEDSRVNLFYHRNHNKQVSGKATWWDAANSHFIYWCANDRRPRWHLATITDWNNAGADFGSDDCPFVYKQQSEMVSPMRGSYVGNGQSSGDIDCVNDGYSDVVEVRNMEEDWAGWYAADRSKVFNGVPTYWNGEGKRVIYWCESSSEWHLRSIAAWVNHIEPKDECEPPTTWQYRKAGELASNGDLTSFAYPAGGWERWTGSVWQSMDTRPPLNIQTVVDNVPSATVSGFLNYQLNKRYYEVPSKRHHGKPTYWDNSGAQSLIYYCRQEDQWRIASANVWHDELQDRQKESCSHSGYKAVGHFIANPEGFGHWWQIKPGADELELQEVIHETTAGDCNRFMLGGLRQAVNNEAFQGFTLEWSINGRPSYWTHGTLHIIYWCAAEQMWFLTQGYDKWVDARNGLCPGTARKVDGTAASKSGGWEESCTPNSLVIVQAGATRTCPTAGSTVTSLGTRNTAELCLAACSNTAGCQHATWDGDSKECKQYSSCSPDAYIQATVATTVISWCPASGWAPTQSTTGMCEGSTEVRRTIQGCECAKVWEYQGKIVENYCGRPDGSDWDWCFVTDPDCFNGYSWGWCAASHVAAVAQLDAATPAPPAIVDDDARVSEPAIREGIDAISEGGKACCGNAIAFSPHSGTYAHVSYPGGDVKVEMQVTYTRWPISEQEQDEFEEVLAEYLRIPVSRLAEVTFSKGFTKHRGWHSLVGAATVTFLVRNPPAPEGGMQGWHAALITCVCVTAAVLTALCLFAAFMRPKAVSGSLRKADASHLLFDSGVTRARVAGNHFEAPRTLRTPRLVDSSSSDVSADLWDKLSAAKRLRVMWDRLLANRSRRLCSMLFGSEEARQGARLDFTDLAVMAQPLSLTCSTRPVLQQCTGLVRGGKLSAVLGPSGAGKTALLQALAGRTACTGTVRVGGSEIPMGARRELVGFVPQSDTALVPELTVAENIAFSARMRSRNRSDAEVERITEVILTLLALKPVRGQRVGAGERDGPGVSSGQRKRVSIAVELVAEPKVLVLDEPTSGLDAQAALSLCSLLRSLADFGGVTVVAALHQPSPQILSTFDDLILLAPDHGPHPGGRLVYNGPVNSATTYFDKIVGIPCNTALAGTDESSFLILALNGGIEFMSHGQSWQRLEAEELEARWSHFTTDASCANERKAILQAVTLVDADDAFLEQMQPQQLPSHFRQAFVFFDRAVVQGLRRWRSRVIDVALVAVAGFYTGLIFVGQRYISPECAPPCDLTSIDDVVKGINHGRSTERIRAFLESAVDPFPTQAAFVVLAVAICTACSDLRVFTSLMPVFKQESAQGLSVTSFFVANDAANVVWIALAPLAFLVPYWLWVHEAGVACAPFWGYYEVLLPLSFAASALAYLVSVFVPRANAQLAVAVCVLVLMRVYDIQDLPWLRYASFMRWAQEAFYLEDYHCLAEKAATSNGAFTVGEPPHHAHSSTTAWNKDGFAEALSWLWAWGVFLRLGAWAALCVRKHKGSN